MKTRVKLAKMKPITIILETPQELHDMHDVCYNADWSERPVAYEIYKFLSPYTLTIPKPEVIIESEINEQTSEQ